MNTGKTFRWFCGVLIMALLLAALSLPAFAAEKSGVFVQTAKVGSTKIVKDGAVYDMYTYTGGQAALQQDADGTLWVPVRIVSELAGMNVVWDGQEDTVKLTDPVTGDYWMIGIDWDFAIKYHADGELLTQHWMHKLARMRGGAVYISIQDIEAIYGFQVYERVYEGDTYVVVTNQPLTMSYAEITALCETAAALL